MFDDFAIPGEPKPHEVSKTTPDAMCFLSGSKYYKSIGNGIAYGTLEAARLPPLPIYGIEGDVLYMIHGTFNENAVWRKIGKDDYKDFEFPSIGYTPVDSSNADEKTLAGREGVKTILDVGITLLTIQLK